MTSMRTDAHPSMNGHLTPPPLRAGTELPTRQKHSGYVALAVVLIVGLAALGAYFYTQAGKKVPVVVVIHDVAAGHPIGRSDLSTVDVAGAVTAIGGANMNSVVGQTAAVPLLANTLLQRSMVSSAPALGAGQARVGIRVKPGQIPADGLNPGDTVEILQLPAKDPTAGASTAAGVVLAEGAPVFSSAADSSQTGGSLLTVVVPTARAAGIAAASNAGLIALVAVGR